MKSSAPLLLALLTASCATSRGGEAAAPAEGAAAQGPAAATAAPAAPSPPGDAPATPARPAEVAAPAPAAPSPPATPDWAHGLPPPLPPPELPPTPPPEAPPMEALLPAVVANVDLMDLVWSHRLDFGEAGVPLVTIRLMEGQREIVFRARGRAKVTLRGREPIAVAPNAVLRVRLVEARPAAFVRQVLLDAASVGEVERLADARRTWEERGLTVRSRVVGGVFGIGGRIVDNRREILFADGDGTEATARKLSDDLERQFGSRLPIDARLADRPAGKLLLFDAKGDRVGEADSALALDVEGGAGFVVEGVQHDLRERGREREDRAYGGRLVVTVDAAGKLAAIHAVAMEELLRGLVPAEMPALSHLEALKAQAVTARSNMLAQIGVRHLEDPYMLCAEVHCQAYRGEGAHHPRTDEAIRATAGEAIFGRKDQRLVDAVYHAMCGGHGENNEYVWGNTPDAELRGRPDLPDPAAAPWAGGLSEEAKLRRFLAADVDAWCRRPAATRRDRWRWERRLTPADLEEVGASLGIGAVRSMEIRARGVSGRARYLRVTGAGGTTEVAGELKIRRLLRNLPSAMFVFDRDGADWIARGGGWGHGAGMCQWGAVGRAEAGQDYRQILKAYYSGAEVAKVY
ncbi:MAG TPA: SpoIID/LytB domain-containing protein [Anaeromyxobacteraceae bacterium]|nr:SpoIID/LytB domain-containing protein [Anaeromyxobacteraceae bacterium]